MMILIVFSGKIAVCGQRGSPARFAISSIVLDRLSLSFRSTKMNWKLLASGPKTGSLAFKAADTVALLRAQISMRSRNAEWFATTIGASAAVALWPTSEIHQTPMEKNRSLTPNSAG